MTHLLLALVGLLLPGDEPVEAPWPQWGGPHRNFTADAGPLADAWPEAGPPRRWDRELGDGYSSIVIGGGRLYTLSRKRGDLDCEYVVALDAKTGETAWESELWAPIDKEPNLEDWGGGGPNSTPLLVGDRLFAVGSWGFLVCLDRTTGEMLWERDLGEDFGFQVGENAGYSPSPLAHDGLLIVPVGTRRRGRAGLEGTSLVALDQETGEEAWSTLSFQAQFCSPIVVRCHDRDQLVLPTYHELLGVAPSSGELLWSHPVGGSIVTPVWNGEDLVFYSCGGDEAPGMVVRLEREDDRIVPHQVWAEEKDVLLWQPTPIRVGEHLYGATTEDLVCVEMATGEIRWREKGFPLATGLAADGKLIFLDENGLLSLVAADPSECRLLGRTKVGERYAFAAPALAGTTLYVRDRKRIMALDLSAIER